VPTGRTDPGGGRAGPASSAPAGSPSAVPTAPMPGRTEPLRAAGAQPDGVLTRGKNGKIAVNIQNSADSPATNVVADVTLPAGVQLRTGGDSTTEDTQSLVPTKKWACSATATGATCTLGQLAAGATTTLELKVTVAPTARTGALTGTLAADAAMVGQIPASQILITDATTKKKKTK
jgi:hypothetical protein